MNIKIDPRVESQLTETRVKQEELLYFRNLAGKLGPCQLVYFVITRHYEGF